MSLCYASPILCVQRRRTAGVWQPDHLFLGMVSYLFFKTRRDRDAVTYFPKTNIYETFYLPNGIVKVFTFDIDPIYSR